THSWSITGDGSIVGSTTGPSVQVLAGSVAGTFTVTDNATRDGCPTTCSKTVDVSKPSCDITGPTPVCFDSTNTYTSTVTPAGGMFTHSWSITGNGTIVGSTTGPSVQVHAGSTTGSFTVTDNATRDTCP